MENELLNTDEEIIYKYSKIFGEFGPSEKCFDAVKKLESHICPEKKELWKTIIDGLLYSLKGDGLNFPLTYDNTEEYKEAGRIFAGVLEKIENKNSLLFIFVEEKRITSLALSKAIDNDEIIRLYDNNIINKYKDDKDEAVQSIAVKAMLNKSFVLWQNNKEGITYDLFKLIKDIQIKIIDTYSSSKNMEIQISVAKCLNNHANTIEEEYEMTGKKINDTRDKLISMFENIEDDNLSIQVSRAMFNKALSLQTFAATEEVKKKWTLSNEDFNYEQQALDTYSKLIDKFNNSNISNIQSNVAYAMSRKGDILSKQKNINKSLNIYSELIDNFKNNKDDYVLLSVADALYKKGEILVNLAYEKDDITYFEKAIIVYEELINLFKDNKKTIVNDLNIYNVYVIPAKIEIVNLLKIQLGNITGKEYSEKLNYSLGLIDELISLNLSDNICFILLKNKAEILRMNAYYIKNAEKLKNTIAFETEIINKYKNNTDIEIQVDISYLMICKGCDNVALENYQEAIDIFQEIIKEYDKDNFIKYKIFDDIIKTAKQNIEVINKKMPILDIFKFYTLNRRSIDDLIKSIAQGNIVPVIGAGLSKFVFPLWKEFLANAFKNHENLIKGILFDKFKELNCKEQATKLVENIKIGMFQNEVKHTFSDEHIKNLNKDDLKKECIWFLPKLFNKQIILTTNFDNLIDRVFLLQGNTSIEKCTYNDISKIEDRDHTKILLYKIHGCIDNYKEIILTEDDFKKIYTPGEPAYIGMQKSLRNRDILFLGCSLEDKHEILQFCKDKDTNTTIYAICPCEDKKDIQKIESDKLSEQGVNAPIFYPLDAKHSYLFSLLEYIAYCVSDARRNEE